MMMPAFAMPDFTRVMWASARARAVWEPRIAHVTAAWEQIERWSVADRIRPAALQSLAPAALIDAARWAAEHGLVALPLAQAGASGQYSASTASVVDGQSWMYRVAITRPEFAELWTRAWADHDDDMIGSVLGFPDCCRAFFARTWGAGSVDPTGQMGAPGARGPLGANSLLRWLGVRLVPHMPCGFTCAKSGALGAELAAVGRAHGLVDEIGWIEEMLDWPIEWSGLHGIAEIKTPVLKIATRTDYTPRVQTIRRAGGGYPDEGVSGNTFPYERPAAINPLTLHRSYKAAFAVDDWTDNGFASREAMNAAHAMVIDALRQSPPKGTVYDLGAGNGLLMRKVRATFGCKVGGIERHAAKVDDAGGVTEVKDLRDILDTTYASLDTIVVSRRRFEEIPKLEAWCRQNCRQLLVYSYDEPLFARVEAVR